MNIRKIFLQVFVVLIAVIIAIKLFLVQVVGSEYANIADNNVLLKKIEYPNRGVIRDREGDLLVKNAPVFNLKVIPKKVPKDFDTLAFCELLSISRQTFEQKMAEAKDYSYVKASDFMQQIPAEEFARIQDRLMVHKGFFEEPRSKRFYPDSLLSSAVGYIGEISRSQLEQDTLNYYRQGDYIGISGIEEYYEDFLRGKRGARYVMVDVRGMERGVFREGKFDTLSVPGEQLISSIDLELQQYAEKLMKGKVGSLVAIEPETGEILAMVSAPFYNPNLLTGRDFGKNYTLISQDTTKPLFNRPTMAMYPPGSIFKSVQALIALEEEVITPNEQIGCFGSPMGDHASFGYYDVERGIMHSSNTYFYNVFKRLIQRGDNPNKYLDARPTLAEWNDYLSRFGFGSALGIDLKNEKPGMIPGLDYYDQLYGENRWKFSNIYSLSIGQGEILVTPLQMANLAAIIANRGHFYRPHLIKGIGVAGQKLPQFAERLETGIDSSYYEPVIAGMAKAIYGTAQRAVIPNIEICGKTGTAENPHGEDHSVFMAFAPRQNPKIAISVYVENAGWGGRAAASTASLVMEHYLKDGKIERQWLEDYVLRGEFLY
jgi:penicillin-binding protein 2